WCGTTSTPGRAARKSVCHDLRRNSPSVIDFSPTASCFAISAVISWSSICFRHSAEIAFLARSARACFSAAGRSRLPTWSARNGGVVRGDMRVALKCSCYSRELEGISGSAPPYLVRQFDDHAQLRPLILLGEHIALLSRGEAALRRKTKLLERHVFGRLVDAALDVVLLLQHAALRRDEAEHDLLVALRE